METDLKRTIQSSGKVLAKRGPEMEQRWYRPERQRKGRPGATPGRTGARAESWGRPASPSAPKGQALGAGEGKASQGRREEQRWRRSGRRRAEGKKGQSGKVLWSKGVTEWAGEGGPYKAGREGGPEEVNREMA